MCVNYVEEFFSCVDRICVDACSLVFGGVFDGVAFVSWEVVCLKWWLVGGECTVWDGF